MNNTKYNLIAIIIWFFITFILIEMTSAITSILTPKSTYNLLRHRLEYPNVIFVK